MAHFKQRPVALTIAGSDSGGGAGIQADLKTFAALGVHGASVITALTAQNPKCVIAVEPCSPRMLRQQLFAIAEELAPAAMKTGMLPTAAAVRLVMKFAKTARHIPLVVDPVLVSTSGRKLVEPAAIKLVLSSLLPLAALVTPNLNETEILAGWRPASVEEMRVAAREIHDRHGCAALVKGGHLANSRTAVDIFYDGNTELFLSAPFIRGLRTHGTGCTYSAAITAELALGHALPEAVGRAKHFITSAIAGSYRVRGHFALGVMGEPQGRSSRQRKPMQRQAGIALKFPV